MAALLAGKITFAGPRALRRGRARAAAPVVARPGGLSSSRVVVPPPRAQMGPGDQASPVVATADEEMAQESLQNPFLDSFVRAFLLGVGAGGLCEVAHVGLNFLGLALSSHANLFESLDQFSPLIVLDHVAAVGSWVLLYTIEAIAILSVLNRYPNDAQQAARTISSMATLSKKMLPLRISSLKRVLARGVFDRSPAAAPAVPFAFRGGNGGAGTATLERELADIEAAARAPLPRVPTLPRPAPPSKPTQDEEDEDRDDTAARAPAPAPAPPAVEVQEDDDDEAITDDLRTRRARRGLRPGQWDPTAAAAKAAGAPARAKELADRKAYLRNFWYAAALSSNLKAGEPLGVDILGSRVVLWRDAERGAVRCLDDACPHRGAPLSAGWLAPAPAPAPTAGNPAAAGGGACSSKHEQAATAGAGSSCVVCPYHGWAFDGAGRLRDVPSAEPGRWPKRAVARSYPVEERGGFVWLFFGDAALPPEERPPIPYTPELDAPGWKAVYGEMEFECGHWGVFENAIDMAHIHYLHGDSFGNSEQPRIMGMTTTRDTFHVEAAFRIHNKPVSKLWEFTAVESVPVHAKAMLPSSSSITITLGAGVSMITFVNTVPISENRCVNRFCLIRNFAGWDGFDAWARKAMFKILGEDKVMVERLAPERLGKELSLGPDAPQLAFRKLRQEWVDMGYAAPTEGDAPERRGLATDR